MPRLQSLEQLKAALGPDSGYADQDLLEALAQYKKVPISKAAEMYGYDKAKGPWAERGGAAIDSYQAGMYGLVEDVAGRVGSSVVSNWAKGGRERNELQSGISRERAKLGGIPDDWREIDGPGSGVRFVGGLALDSLPYVAEAAVGGVVGRVVAGGAKLAAGASAADRAAHAAQGARAATGGAIAASYPSSVGDILNNQREEGGETTAAAYGLGVPYAALNAFGLEGMAARTALPRVVSPVLDNISGVKGRIARGGVTGIQTAISEGGSEMSQEMINQLGRMSANEQQTFWNEEAKKRYVDSFVGGAALGGVVGGGLSGGRRSQGYSSPMAAPPVAPDAPPPPAGGLDVLRLGYDAPPFITFPDGTTATSDDAAFRRRFAPQPADAPSGPDSQRAIGWDGNPLLLGYDPSAGRGTMIGLPGGQAALTEEEAFRARMAPQALDPAAPIQTAAPTLGEGATTTPVPVLENVQNAAPAADIGAQDAPPVAGSGTPEALARIEETKVRKVAAEDAIVRAKEAGMESEKQQMAFWRMEELEREGKLSSSKAAQIQALLMQSKFGKVDKILDDAATGAAGDNVLAKYKKIDNFLADMDKHAVDQAAAAAELETLRDAVPPKADKLKKPEANAKAQATWEVKQAAAKKKAEAKMAAATAKHKTAFDQVMKLRADPAVVATPETTPEVPATLVPAQPAPAPVESAPAPAPVANPKAKKLKATAEKANKIRRYESLLACLGR